MDVLATSDMDPVDVALHKAVVPQPSKRQWILKMSLEERNYMLRFVSLAISCTGGMTEVTRLIIRKEFLISPALVNVIASWVLSCEVDDDKLTDDQRSAAPLDSWLHHAEQLVLPGWLQEIQQSMANNPALGPNQGAACSSCLRRGVAGGPLS